MHDILATLAFAALIGAQFLAVVTLNASKATIYADPSEHEGRPARASSNVCLRQRTFGAGAASARCMTFRVASR